MANKAICKFNEDYNTCIYLNRQTSECSNPNQCTFKDNGETEKAQNPYARKERWYEKYYK